MAVGDRDRIIQANAFRKIVWTVGAWYIRIGATAYIPDKKRNAYSDIFPFSLPFLVQVV